MIRFPADVSGFRKTYGYNSQNFFTTTNPKTLKNGVVSDNPTIVLHLEPITGGLCPAAGSCAALCLNKAGNPVYLEGKLSRRQKRTASFFADQMLFAQLLVLEAARYRAKGYVGVRLNGTSDNDWENQTVRVTEAISAQIAKLTGTTIGTGDYSTIAVLVRMGYVPYDYTKRIDRNFKLCKELGYHLTLSWGGKYDGVIWDVAQQNGLNVAAPLYGIKKKQPLPQTVTLRNGRTVSVVDGDLTDWRVDDPQGAEPMLVGLRLKRTPDQTEELARRFCIA